MEVTILLNSQNVKDLIAKEYGVSAKDIKMTTYLGDVTFMFDVDEDEKISTKDKDEVITMLNDLADEISSLAMYNDPLDIADYIREKINTLKAQEDGKLLPKGDLI